MNSSLSSLLNGFDDSLWLRSRVRVAAQGAQSTNGDFVLYWMHNAVRAHENPALDVALLAAEELGTSVLVYHAISEQYPFASDRLHAFMLQGARDVQWEFAQRGIPYVFHLEREGQRGPHLRTLAERAALVVTEDVPVEPICGWVDRLTETTTTPVWAVDSSCVVPMQLVGKAYTRAFAFRDATAAMYDERMGFEPSRITDPSDWRVPNDLPFEPLDLATSDFADLIGDCRIDHAVGPVPHTCGGSEAGYDRWNAFKASGLRAYAKNRNNALLGGVSRMSAYLHYGMVSPFRLAREAMQVGRNGAEKYLEELLIWRELAWVFCFYQRDHEAFSALPKWAVETLADHEEDARSRLFDWETLARGKTGDRLWDAAQMSLLMHGELHNNVRMTWGKAIINWTQDAGSALAMMIDLNHRYALDGRDPASYGGLLWCLGQFDRPFNPEQLIFGTVRPRPTREHAKRLDPARYLRNTTRPLIDPMPTIAVIGAGMAGLAAARTLTDHGFDVTVFDKGRGVGGRMATRHTDIGFHFDHGAQYFSARDERFRRYVESWQQAGTVARWNCRIVDIDRGLTCKRDSSDRFVGVPGMNAVCQHIARDVTVHSGVTISSMRRDKRWQLFAADQETGEFDHVVLAMPPVQAAELLDGISTLSDRISQIPLAPCWAVMLAFAKPIASSVDGAFVKNASISWIARNSSKPDRPSAEDCWVLHGSADWSAAHLECSGEQIVEQLLPEFFSVLDVNAQQPLQAVTHRWRYANPAEPLTSGFLRDAGKNVVVCGDWCLGNRVEAAFLSGISAAGAIMRHALLTMDAH